MACATTPSERSALWLADGPRALTVVADGAWFDHLRADPGEAADGALGPDDLPSRPPGSSAIPLQCHDPRAAIANRGDMGPACDDAAIESRQAGEMARDIATDGADAEDVDAHGLLLARARGENRSPARSSCRGIRETASAEAACGTQASSPAEIHLLLEPSI